MLQTAPVSGWLEFNDPFQHKCGYIKRLAHVSIIFMRKLKYN